MERQYLDTDVIHKEESILKDYTFYWLDGKKEVLEGETPSDAFIRAGYGAGALRAVDFFDVGITGDYKWDVEAKTWVKNKDV